MVREYLGHFGRLTPPARLFLGAHFLFGVVHATIFILRNLFLERAGYSEDFIGSSMSAAAFGMVAVLALVPRFMDRMKLKGFLASGVLLLAAGLAGVALLPYDRPLERYEFPVMAFCFLSGVGAMTFEVGTAPFYTRHSSEEERPYLFGMGMALSPVAGLTAALAVGLAAGGALDAHRAVMLGGASAALLCAAVLVFVREVPPEPETGEPEEPVDWPLAFKFALPELIIGLGAGLSIPILNLYFTRRFGFDAGTFGLLFAGTQVLMMLGFLLAPILARRLGAVRTIVLLQLFSIPFFVGLAFATSPVLAMVLYLLRHPCMNMVHPVAANFMMGVASPRQRVRLNAVKQLANKIAWVIATWSGGRIVTAAAGWGGASFLVDGFTAVMLVTVGFYVAGAAVYGAFFRSSSAGKGTASVPVPEPSREE